MDRNERNLDDVSDRTERAANDVSRVGDRTAASVRSGDVVHHDDHPTAGDQVGEAAGGIGGVLAGAAIGSVAGPIGTVIGGLAGAVGGWWTGRAIAEAASNFTHSDDLHYRSSYDTSEHRLADRSYDDIRPAYQLGYLASRNPDYVGREFEEVETELERGWSADVSRSSGNWQQVRGFARDAFARGRETGSEGERGVDVGSEAPSGVKSTGASWHTDELPAASTKRQPSNAAPADQPSSERAGELRASGFTDNVRERQQQLRGQDAGGRASFSDPVAGEGVENIGSSGLSNRDDD
jgi:outer membrane lipoprotein SlyB